jgi:hypothetical protein
MFAWSQLDFYVIPVSISALSVTAVRENCKEYQMYRKGKDIRKMRQLAVFVFVPSLCGEKFPTAEF